MNSDSTITKTTPINCKTRDLTYEVDIKVDIHYKKVITVKGKHSQEVIQETEKKTIRKVTIASIPVMVKSKLCRLTDCSTDQELIDLDECPYDQGGYFIVNGCEKIITGQERLSYNEVLMFKTKMDTEPWVAEIRSIA